MGTFRGPQNYLKGKKSKHLYVRFRKLCYMFIITKIVQKVSPWPLKLCRKWSQTTRLAHLRKNWYFEVLHVIIGANGQNFISNFYTGWCHKYCSTNFKQTRNLCFGYYIVWYFWLHKDRCKDFSQSWIFRNFETKICLESSLSELFSGGA